MSDTCTPVHATTPDDTCPPGSSDGASVPDPTPELFASRTLTEHVARGVLGLVLVAFAVVSAQEHPWALLALAPAVLAWRGCPTCWLMGLGATLARRRSREPGCDTC